MRIAIVLVLAALAALVAGLTAFFMYRMIPKSDVSADGQGDTTAPSVAAVQVLVAASPLPAGTTLDASHLRWQPWPSESLDESFISESKDDDRGVDGTATMVGTVVRRGIVIGEPVTENKVFRRESVGFLAGALAPGMRAVAISVNAETSAAGFILPGNRVDVILIQELATASIGQGAVDSPMKVAGETVLRNVRVLALDQRIEDFAENAEVGKTVTLELTPKQAEILAVATVLGELTLSLRSLSRDENVSYGGFFTSDLEVSEALSGGQAAAWRHAGEVSGLGAGRVLGLFSAGNLPAGTVLSPSHVHWRPIEIENLPKGAVSADHTSGTWPRGAYLSENLQVGAPVTEAVLVMPDDPGFLARALAPGKATVEIGSDAAAGLIDLIFVGDRVAIGVTESLRVLTGSGIGEPRATNTNVYRDLRVLEVDTDRGVLTIEVPEDQHAAIASGVESERASVRLQGLGGDPSYSGPRLSTPGRGFEAAREGAALSRRCPMLC